jgi:hypothetical protein
MPTGNQFFSIGRHAAISIKNQSDGMCFMNYTCPGSNYMELHGAVYFGNMRLPFTLTKLVCNIHCI